MSLRRKIGLLFIGLFIQRRKASQSRRHCLAGSGRLPCLPEDGYGWEKLFSERMCRHFEEDFGLQCRLARSHSVHGPQGTYEGGREKTPTGICHKVIEAKLFGKYEIEIWGNGHQMRSFMYIDVCIKGIGMIVKSEILKPINLGSS